METFNEASIQAGIAEELIRRMFESCTSEKQLIELARQYPVILRYHKGLSEKVQLAAVKKYGYAIRYIPNPSKKVQKTAINTDPYCIEVIPNIDAKLEVYAKKLIMYKKLKG